MSEFDQAEVIEHTDSSNMMVGGTAEYRDELIRKYHKGSSSLVDKLKDDGFGDNETLIAALIEELVKETDNLLGNELIAIENGSVRDSSVISSKRSEVIEKAVKAIQSKQAFEKENGIDLDSPSMVVIFTYFIKKSKETLVDMGKAEEEINLFLSTLGEKTDGWKAEVRKELDIMKSR